MRITIGLDTATAIRMGRNTTYTLTLDAAVFTPEQRARIASGVYHDEMRHDRLLTPTGDLTPESVQAVLDAEAADKARHIAEARARIQAAIDSTSDSYPSDDESYLRYLTADPAYEVLAKAYAAAHAAQHDRYEARKARERIEEDKKRAEQRAADALAVERRAAEDAPKIAQLTEAVERLGTPVQIERWRAGVMARKEAIDLIRGEIVAPLVAVGIEPLENEAHIEECDESDKSTLTDAQWIMVKKVLSLMPAGTVVTYHHQYNSSDESCDVMRMSMSVGAYIFEIDVILPNIEGEK